MMFSMHGIIVSGHFQGKIDRVNLNVRSSIVIDDTIL